MNVRLAVLALLASVVCLPASAGARTEAPAGPSLAVVDVPLRGERVLAAAAAPKQFDLVGLHWQGAGSVRFRALRQTGGWTPWHLAAPEAGDAPDAGSAEARQAGGWTLGSPWWVGRSTRIEYRVSGGVRRLRAYLVTSPVEPAGRVLASATTPPIVSRAGWHADESIRRAAPQYFPSLQFAVVHHTAGSNDYDAEEAPAVVRAIELYHVQGNGWNDIGYNFLVDRFGTVYEGRYGGTDRNVVGAHALGFNRGSVGIAVIGTYVNAAPPQAALDALARLISWRLDLAHVDPVSTVQVTSGGSERYKAGVPVTLRAVSGHLDTGLTACPGQGLYARLPAIAAKARSLGLPKIFAPVVTGRPGGPVRFQAAISSALPWTVTVADQAGAPVASGSGTGTAVDWSWDATSAAPGPFSWTIAVAGATSATGVLGAAAPAATALAVTDAAVEPVAISPNGDGQADTATVTYTTSQAAQVGVTVVDATGQDVGVLQAPADEPAGTHTLAFSGDGLPDGRYTLRIDAVAADTTVSGTVEVAVSRTLGSVAVTPKAFSPNGDGRADTLTVRFTLLAAAPVRIRVLRDGTWVATVLEQELAAGQHVVRWNGAKRVGRLLDGSYTAEVGVTDAAGDTAYDQPFTADVHPPVVRILPGKALRLSVSEPALVTVRAAGRTTRLTVAAAGTVRVPGVTSGQRARIVAWDAAGNVSVPIVRTGAVRSAQ